MQQRRHFNRSAASRPIRGRPDWKVSWENIGPNPQCGGAEVGQMWLESISQHKSCRESNSRGSIYRLNRTQLDISAFLSFSNTPQGKCFHVSLASLIHSDTCCSISTSADPFYFIPPTLQRYLYVWSLFISLPIVKQEEIFLSFCLTVKTTMTIRGSGTQVWIMLR